MLEVHSLKNDRKRIEALLDEIEQRNDAARKRRLFLDVKSEWDRYAWLEETALYPEFRQRPEFKALIEDSLANHRSIKDLMSLMSRTRDRIDFEAQLGELIDEVREHMRLEERELFPQIIESLKPQQKKSLEAKVNEARRAYDGYEEAA